MICPSCNGTGEMPELKLNPALFVDMPISFSCKCGASYLFPEDAVRCCERCSVCDAVKCHAPEMNRAAGGWRDGNRSGLCPHPEQAGHSETCTCMGTPFRIKGSGTPR